MQVCGRSVKKTGRNRNNWRLVIGMPMASYGAAIIVSSRFVSGLCLFLVRPPRPLCRPRRETTLHGNLRSIKLYDCARAPGDVSSLFGLEKILAAVTTQHLRRIDCFRSPIQCGGRWITNFLLSLSHWRVWPRRVALQLPLKGSNHQSTYFLL